MQSLGLRLKFNAVLLPFVAAAVVGLGWLDARQERATLIAAHAMHAPAPDSTGASTPVDTSDPVLVARRTFLLHAGYAAALVLLIAAGINIALSRFVLTPIERIGDGIEKMERGHWRLPQRPEASDEVGRVVENFQRLGLRVDAIVLQLLHAERLATLAWVARKAATQIEPRVERIAAEASELQQSLDPAARHAARTIATADAEILGAVKSLDRLFDASVQAGKPSLHSGAPS